MKKRKLAIAVLSSFCILGMAGCGDDNPTDQADTAAELDKGGALCNDYKVGGKVILGNGTQLSGDFRWAGLGKSSAGASDQDIKHLISGYSTMELNKAGDYVWNKTVVKSHTEVEKDSAGGGKDLEVTIEINPGLKLSDGSELKAKNFLAYILAMSTPVSKEAFGVDTGGQSIVGQAARAEYDGTNAGADIKKEFAGLRLLGDYKFSILISGDAGYYPYYFADTLGAVSPYDIKMCIGDADIKDDGNGAYLTEKFYEKVTEEGATDTYKMSAILRANQYENSEKFAFTGPYKIAVWNSTSKECTLVINENFAGNYEGQKPHVETIVYKHVISQTQNAALKTGTVDILEAITGGDEVKSALKVKEDSNGKFKENHYDRAGYGKLEFECDFGPTSYAEVRQAVAYCLDRADFANTFTGGYGSIVNGPYSVNFQAYLDTEAYLESKLNKYNVNAASAAKALSDAGWTYNSQGVDQGANWKPGTGVDQVRYMKLAGDKLTDVNKAYAAVSVDTVGGVEYKTVKVGDDYFMPCVINWFCTEDNPVSDLLTTKLQKGNNIKQAGLDITKTEGDFTKLLGEIYREPSYGYTPGPTYGLLNLATGWNTGVYDYSYNWIGNNGDMFNATTSWYDRYFTYSSNKLTDPYDADFSWFVAANQGKSYDEAVAASNGKLGMNYISFAMVYSVKPGNTAEYNKWFDAYMVRWNELLPDIPLYCNIYYDVYNANIVNYKTSPFFGAADALLYCACKDAQ
ncbi:MAG: hypothetical protein K6E21_04975 [Bacilli bacterium]|nr:hypothetical protein [Bacilli bacterium]